MDDVAYRSIRKRAIIEFNEKKSKFIGHAAPTQSVDEAEEFIKEISAEHSSATHNVWAYRLGISGQIQKFSDAGEPSQTAGMPTLDVMLKTEITQLVIVTTRYFGGIMLGAGGLVRAYSRAASNAIAASGIVNYGKKDLYRFTVSYTQWGAVQNHCEIRGWHLQDIEYLENVTATALVNRNMAESLKNYLRDATGGKGKITYLSSIYAPFEERKQDL